MNDKLKRFKTRTTFALLTAVIVGTVDKLPRFRHVPREKLIDETYGALRGAVEKRN